ncbi:hypothetical protein CFP56_036256 [Quercus suber]|uniref:Uncharacterized protein n=1 Tax=Quercus suber TaxID=58331 RepID=A0AAW0J8P0_QUESU
MGGICEWGVRRYCDQVWGVINILGMVVWREVEGRILDWLNIVDNEYFHHPECFSNALEFLVTKSIISSLKEFSITKSIVIISTHRIMTMPIDSVIRDLSRILLTHRIMIIPIDFIIKDLSHILLAHQIVPMPIHSIIKDMSRDVMHLPNPSDHSPLSHLIKSSHLLY